MSRDRMLTQPTIVPVGDLAHLPDGRERLVTSIELWDDRVLLRSAEAPAPRPDDELGGLDVAWEIEDDIGTAYRRVGSGGGGGGDRFSREVRFMPAVPAAASLVRLRSPEGRAIEVSVSGQPR